MPGALEVLTLEMNISVGGERWQLFLRWISFVHVSTISSLRTVHTWVMQKYPLVKAILAHVVLGRIGARSPGTPSLWGRNVFKVNMIISIS